MGDLLAGGLGYLAGSYSQRATQYQQPYYPPQYQQQYQQPAAPAQNARIAQLQLLGQLRQSGTLTEDEFQAEKQRILSGT